MFESRPVRVAGYGGNADGFSATCFSGDIEMIEQKEIVAPEKVTCEVCFKEIPISEATSVKATDYIVYYCGLDCYDRWRKQKTEAAESSKD